MAHLLDETFALAADSSAWPDTSDAVDAVQPAATERSGRVEEPSIFIEAARPSKLRSERKPMPLRQSRDDVNTSLLLTMRQALLSPPRHAARQLPSDGDTTCFSGFHDLGGSDDMSLIAEQQAPTGLADLTVTGTLTSSLSAAIAAGLDESMIADQRPPSALGDDDASMAIRVPASLRSPLVRNAAVTTPRRDDTPKSARSGGSIDQWRSAERNTAPILAEPRPRATYDSPSARALPSSAGARFTTPARVAVRERAKLSDTPKSVEPRRGVPSTAERAVRPSPRPPPRRATPALAAPIARTVIAPSPLRAPVVARSAPSRPVAPVESSPAKSSADVRALFAQMRAQPTPRPTISASTSSRTLADLAERREARLKGLVLPTRATPGPTPARAMPAPTPARTTFSAHAAARLATGTPARRIGMPVSASATDLASLARPPAVDPLRASTGASGTRPRPIVTPSAISRISRTSIPVTAPRPRTRIGESAAMPSGIPPRRTVEASSRLGMARQR